MVELGNAWLLTHFALDVRPLTKMCLLGSRSKIVPGNDMEWEYFQKQYLPADTPLAHVEFALKRDHLHLELLCEVFKRIPAEEVATWVKNQPTGKWARRIGYLCEFLTGVDLHPQDLAVGGNYTLLLEPDKYVVAAKPVKIPRWRIEDNLLGEREFCPVVRRTGAVETALGLDVSARLNALLKDYPPEIYRRAVGYLYEKETRTSFEIERETPTPDREALFVAILHAAGKAKPEEVLSEARLAGLQSNIVEPRYAQTAYRDDQNYIGQTLPNHQQKVHFIPPPPQFVRSLMLGLGHCLAKSTGSDAISRAAIAAFGFVFIHPFEDGNGRLHRFLIHDVLAMDRFVPAGVVLPVSAWMLNNMASYDDCLEKFSIPLMEKIRRNGGYDLYAADHDIDRLTVTNPSAIELFYRYPDMTVQVEYLARAIEGALSDELIPELDYLQGFDRAKRAMRQVVDMPDRKLNNLIRFIHQNRGALSKNKRSLYAEITDDEMAQLIDAYQKAFSPNTEEE